MKFILTTLLALGLQTLPSLAGEPIELIGTYQAMVACHDTHHVELAQLVVPGKDKFSGVPHVLNLTEEQRAKLRIGMELKVVGQHKPATKKKLTKAEIRKQMFKHMTQRVGVPPSCRDMDDIIGKLKTGKKGVKAACGHDHGEIELVAAEDDAELVEVTIPAHIEVKKVIITEGGTR